MPTCNSAGRHARLISGIGRTDWCSTPIGSLLSRQLSRAFAPSVREEAMKTPQVILAALALIGVTGVALPASAQQREFCVALLPFPPCLRRRSAGLWSSKPMRCPT
jgi:hypothetical protein